MKKQLCGLALALALPFTAHAWEYDMAEFTCGDIDSEETAAMVLFWLDGYISAEKDDTTVSQEWFEELGTILSSGCYNEPTKKVLDVIYEKYLD
ncbi:hypothetical protein D5085_07085 [Ectothiorhodospiraceae bacterium BW-2]|nr:hypothetical protein D5085_07085 [Ectothiorhodospiraceae bacterium BW-2]